MITIRIKVGLLNHFRVIDATRWIAHNSSSANSYAQSKDYLRKSLQRHVDFNQKLIDSSGKNTFCFDFPLLKLCQLHNISLERIFSLDKRLVSKLNNYKLPPKVYVGLSSGIDSTFSTAILSQLYPGKIVGIYMQNWGQQQDTVTSTTDKCWEKDMKDLENLKKHKNLRIDELIFKSFEKEYWINVFEPFLEVYSKGETPNPDIYCNSLIKFKALMEYIDADLEKNKHRDYLLVMGHYARKLSEKDIHMAYDMKKDQSYYLSRVSPKNIKNCWFPLGHITKKECREYAEKFELPNFDKKDSVGICFVENEKRFNESSHSKGFSNFLSDYIESSEGSCVSYVSKKLYLQDNGKVNRHLRQFISSVESVEGKSDLGKIIWNFKHSGIHTYTIGQRMQAVIPQIDGFKGKWYVSSKDLQQNELVIVNGKEHPDLYKTEIFFRDAFVHKEYNENKHYILKHRSLHLDEPNGGIELKTISGLGDGEGIVVTEKGCSGVSKGQFIVVYDRDSKQVCLNGIIK
ncbi:hypothetical protein QEN19_003602 [Hanseniaspora menglaensis]